MSNMFASWETTINPLAGACQHACGYCWVNDLKKKYPATLAKYSGPPRIVESELRRIEYAKGKVFVGSCTDLWGGWVPLEMKAAIADVCNNSDAEILLCTKNPEGYRDLRWGQNVVLGVTVETDISRVYPVGGAPGRNIRLRTLKGIHNRLMVSVEPVMRFTSRFVEMIKGLQPELEFVFVGYDNYDNGLPEPSLAETRGLIAGLRAAGVVVYEKNMRERLEG